MVGIKGWKKDLDAEAIKFEELLLGDVSPQLINIFFAMTEKKKNPYDAKLIKKVNGLGMVGAGFMGAGIAEVSINDDIHVLLKDISNDMIASAYKGIYDGYNKRVSKKR
ncbi:MAG: hypothetical protein IPI52_15800 [Bacteroidetes bacterium]|nr:hypothetical protein [Bacteroidota bacterium]